MSGNHRYADGPGDDRQGPRSDEGNHAGAAHWPAWQGRGDRLRRAVALRTRLYVRDWSSARRGRRLHGALTCCGFNNPEGEDSETDGGDDDGFDVYYERRRRPESARTWRFANRACSELSNVTFPPLVCEGS